VRYIDSIRGPLGGWWAASTTWSTNVVRGASTPRSRSHALEQEVLTLLRAFGFEICKYDRSRALTIANASPGLLY
jgi:hypothetical protein